MGRVNTSPRLVLGAQHQNLDLPSQLLVPEPSRTGDSDPFNFLRTSACGVVLEVPLMKRKLWKYGSVTQL